MIYNRNRASGGRGMKKKKKIQKHEARLEKSVKVSFLVGCRKGWEMGFLEKKESIMWSCMGITHTLQCFIVYCVTVI